jgi:hypothetical protein
MNKAQGYMVIALLCYLVSQQETNLWVQIMMSIAGVGNLLLSMWQTYRTNN